MITVAWLGRSVQLLLVQWMPTMTVSGTARFKDPEASQLTISMFCCNKLHHSDSLKAVAAADLRVCDTALQQQPPGQGPGGQSPAGPTG